MESLLQRLEAKFQDQLRKIESLTARLGDMQSRLDSIDKPNDAPTRSDSESTNALEKKVQILEDRINRIPSTAHTIENVMSKTIDRVTEYMDACFIKQQEAILTLLSAKIPSFQINKGTNSDPIEVTTMENEEMRDTIEKQQRDETADSYPKQKQRVAD